MILRILQLKDNDDLRAYYFASLDLLKDLNLEVDINNYDVVYVDNDFNLKSKDILEEIYILFQGAKPVSYTGHSLSVSDIIELDDEQYYVDSYGFKKLKK